MMWRIWKYTGWDGFTWAEFRKWAIKHTHGLGWRN